LARCMAHAQILHRHSVAFRGSLSFLSIGRVGQARNPLMRE
jgi:hypothetical protein